MNGIDLMAQFAARENEAMLANLKGRDPAWTGKIVGRAARHSVASNAKNLLRVITENPGSTQLELFRLAGLSPAQWKKAYPILRQSGAVQMIRVDGKGVTLPAAPWEQGEDFAAMRQKRAAARDPWAHLAVKVAGICGAPGCGRKLKSCNITGVCALHPHFKGVCRCVNCTKLAARRAKA